MRTVYIAGPISANNHFAFLANVRKGIETGAILLKAGYAPFNPFLDFMVTLHEEIPRETYYNYSLEWLKRSDCVILLPGWKQSLGTLQEIKTARELHIPVYLSLDELYRKEPLI